MDIFHSIVKVSQNDKNEQSGFDLLNQYSEIVFKNAKQFLTPLEQSLVYGINVSTLDSKGRRISRICYLHEDSSSLLCFIQINSGFMTIFDIKNIQLIEDNQLLQTEFPELQYTPYINLREKTQKIILLFSTQEQLIEMITGLRMLRTKLNVFEPYDEEFSQAKKLLALHRGSISFQNFKRLILQLNYKNHLRNSETINLVKTNLDSMSISQEQFLDFLRIMFCTQIIHKLYNLCAEIRIPYEQLKPSLKVLQPMMLRQQFSNFLITYQKQSTIDQYFKRTSIYYGQQQISMYTFGRFIYSNENSIFNPQLRKIYQDMNHPLNSYYCFSSHNTYLTGNQLTSASKVERYIEDLNRGIKCVEIDVHEKGPGELIVKHGYTPTASILFQDVIRVIADFSSLHKDHWPIIVSIELHLSVPGRETMAEILLKYFGKKIFLIEKGFKRFPSPVELKNKILIKTDCKLDQTLTLQEIEEQQEQQPHIPTIPQQSEALKKKVSRQQFYDNHMNKWLTNEKKAMLARMTSLYKGSFGTESSFCENVSMDWSKLSDRIAKDPQSVIKYTHRSWLRVYPHGTQVFSSNFNPIPIMQVGAQIIALNTQVKDLYYYILQAHFEENSCGYLLKPGELRIGEGLVHHKLIKLSIQIISTLNIRNLVSYEQFKYHVKMGLYGSKQDNNAANTMGDLRQVTQDVTQEDAVFKFSEQLHFTLIQSYYAFIYFQIQQFGRIAVPVRMMRQGYRAVPLLDNNFQPIGASYILVKIDLS